MSKASYEEYVNNTVNSKENDEPRYIESYYPTVQNSSSEDVVKKYSYHFGIDSINLSQVKIEENMCFISEEIEIGYLGEDEYVQITADYYSGGNGSIEFYILDGSEEKPILPLEELYVINERIFFGLRPRFSIDHSGDIVIKKNGVAVDVSLDQAINSNEKGYTVTYLPYDAYDLKIKNNTIQVKMIMRTYDKNEKAPIVKRVSIKKYGRNSLWKDIIIK